MITPSKSLMYLLGFLWWGGLQAFSPAFPRSAQLSAPAKTSIITCPHSRQHLMAV